MMQVVVSSTFTCLHHWPKATEPVEYLKHPHRHVFHVTTWVEVKHEDRDVEIIQLKQNICDFCKLHFGADAGSRSCEQMALEIKDALSQRYHVTRIRVLEDNENGAEWCE